MMVSLSVLITVWIARVLRLRRGSRMVDGDNSGPKPQPKRLKYLAVVFVYHHCFVVAKRSSLQYVVSVD